MIAERAYLAGSVRSSFDSTINVLEGLRQFRKATGGTPESLAATAWGERLLLERNLFRRMSTGQPASGEFLSARTMRRPVGGR